MKLAEHEEEAAARCLEFMGPLTVQLITATDGSHLDRLAMRCALELLLIRVSHPNDHAAAHRVRNFISEKLKAP